MFSRTAKHAPDFSSSIREVIVNYGFHYQSVAGLSNIRHFVNVLDFLAAFEPLVETYHSQWPSYAKVVIMPMIFTESLEDLQKQNLLTDITINVDGNELKAHKAVLAANSEYFRALFSRGFKESNVSEIKIDAFSKETVNQLLKFCYSPLGLIAFSDENVINLLQAALYLQIDDAAELCFGFVNRDSVRAHSHYIALCKAASVADTHGADKEFVECCKSVAYWLIGIYKEETFQKWTTYEMMDKVLDRVDLTKKRNYTEMMNKKTSVVSDSSGYTEGQPMEEHVLEAVVGWLRYDWEARKLLTAALLRKVCLGTIKPEILDKLIDKEMREMKGCQEILAMVEKRRGENKDAELIPGDMFCPRGMIRVLLAVNTKYDGGGAPIPVTTKAQYFYHNDPEKHPDHAIWWRDLPRLQPTPCFRFRLDNMILVNNNLYACCHNFNDANFSVLDLHTCELTVLDFKHPSRNCAVIYHDGWLYALDGFVRHINQAGLYRANAQRFNLLNQISEDLPIGIENQISYPSAIVYKGHIIVYGHIIRSANQGQNTHRLFMYDPSHEINVLYEERHAPYTLATKVRLYSALVKHEDKCYRVTYKREEVRPGTFKDKPKVNELILDLESDPRTCQMGPDQDQSALCIDNKDVQYQGEFCIEEELFFNVKGNIVRTGHKMTRDDKDIAARQIWKYLFHDNIGEACITYGLVDVNVLE